MLVHCTVNVRVLYIICTSKSIATRSCRVETSEELDEEIDIMTPVKKRR